MPSIIDQQDLKASIAYTGSVIEGFRNASSRREVGNILESITHDFGFSHFALFSHTELHDATYNRSDLQSYPTKITERLFSQNRYRRDPIIRACLFSDSAFIWSELGAIIELDRNDLRILNFYADNGLNDGITVPYTRLGICYGSCTFAGTKRSELISSYLGIAQIVGVFAFQAAQRLGRSVDIAPHPPRLNPRPRECVVLAGRGLSDKEIARALALSPRTVNSYLTEARRLFDAHDRTELVVSAILAGEIGLDELRRQPPKNARSI